MHEERDTLWHFVMSIVKYRKSHYVRVLDMYDDLALNNTQGSLVSYLQPIKPNLEWQGMLREQWNFRRVKLLGAWGSKGIEWIN